MLRGVRVMNRRRASHRPGEHAPCAPPAHLVSHGVQWLPGAGESASVQEQALSLARSFVNR